MRDRTIDVRSGQVKRGQPAGQSEESRSVRFSADSTRLVSGGTRGTVRLWDADSLALLGTVTVPVKDDSAAAFAAFSDDSDVVTITAYDGSEYTWDTRIESIIATACTMAGRNLTRDEWTEAFGERPYEKTCP